MNTHGYIEHTPTPERFWTFSNPHYQRYIALTQGYVPTMREDFTYVELGCGNGFSLCINAAANPKATFFGVEMSEENCTAAREMAVRLGLNNVTIRHETINAERDVMTRLFEAKDAVIPETDFLFAHRFLSHVSPEIRTSVFELMGSVVRPGGIAFASYDSMPGSVHRPTYHRIAQSYRGAIEDDVERVEAAFNFANFMYANQAHSTLGDTTLFDDLMTNKLVPAISTHLFGNEHYEPLWFADVSREMNVQGLFYCGTTTAINNSAALVVPEAALEALSPFPDIESLEFVKDMFGNIEFRSDLYIRPMNTDADVGQLLSQMRFILTTPRKLAVSANKVRVGEVELPKELTNPDYDKLARGEALTNLNADIFQVLVGLSMAIYPEVRNTSAINASVHRAFVDYQLENGDGMFVTVVSGLIGSGVQIPKEAMLLYLCGSHGAAKKWLDEHRNSIDEDKLAAAVSTRDDYAKLLKRIAPDL